MHSYGRFFDFKRLIISAIILAVSISISLPLFVSAAPQASTEASCKAAGGEWKNTAPTGGVPSMNCTGIGLAAQQSLDWQIKSLLYYRAVTKCFSVASNVTISSEKIKANDWFINSDFNDFARIGPYMRDTLTGVGEDQTINCYDSEGIELISSALKHWGISSVEFLCGSGFTWKSIPGDKQRCESAIPDKNDAMSITWNSSGSGTGVHDGTNGVISYLKNKFYNNQDPELSTAGWYAFYRKVFFQQCSTTQSAGEGSLTKPSSINNRDISFFDVGTNGSVEERWYRLDQNMVNTSFTTRVGEPTGFADVNRTCEEIAKNHLNQASANAFKLFQDKDPVAANDVSTTIDTDANTPTTSCAIEGIGWIVCPVATFIGGLNDGLWAILMNFLQIQPRIFDVNGDTYRMWSNVRNIANIAFVIVFIIIIYSQLTGLGVSNYGVKKMLPRLIIAAILVNVSFYICAIAVDISNIAGSSLHTMLNKWAEDTSTHTAIGSPVTSWSGMFAWLLSGGAVAWSGIAALTTLGVYGFWGALALLLPSALAALFAFIMVVVLLLARQAFVIILTILAPLALVAYLLPNTNQWFDRWRKFFITLLIMFPTVALLFGGSELAAGVIRAADPSNAWLVMGSLALTALPLFALPTLMKAGGGLMNRIAGVVNNPNRGPIDKLKKRAEGFTKNQEGRRAIRAFSNDKMFGRRGIQRRARNDAVKAGIEKEANRGRAAYIAQEINDNPDFANRVAGGTNGRYGTNADPSAITRALANAQITIDKVEAEEVSAEKVLIEKLPREEVRKILDGAPVGSARHTAAIQRTVESNDLIKINELWEDKGIQSHAQSRTALADALSRSGSRPAYLGQAQLDDMRRGAKSDGSSISSIQDAIDSSVKAGAYSAEKIAIADKDELQIVRTSPGLSDASKAILKNDSEKAANDKNLRLKISKNREEIEKIIGNDWSP